MVVYLIISITRMVQSTTHASCAYHIVCYTPQQIVQQLIAALVVLEQISPVLHRLLLFCATWRHWPRWWWWFRHWCGERRSSEPARSARCVTQDKNGDRQSFRLRK